MKSSISIVIPAYNEENNIRETVKDVYGELNKRFRDYEIILVDDGSTDGTPRVCRELKKKIKKLRIYSHITNLGFGATFKDGIRLARKSYIGGFPGDGDMSIKSLSDMISIMDKYDMVSGVMENPYNRNIFRRILSLLYVRVINFLLGLNLKYYNGYFVCRTSNIKKIELKSTGFDIFAEIKVKFLKGGASVKEIPFIHIGRRTGGSKALSIKSIMQTLRGLFNLAKLRFYR